MAHVWRGLIEEYRDRLPVSDATPVVSLREGGTPLVYACTLSEQLGCEVWLKYDGANPTGSFKDRGMTMAISKAKEAGSEAVICASTGNTSAAAAAYARRGGMRAFVLIPDGYVAQGKLAQALLYGAEVLAVKGNFDRALAIVRSAAPFGAFTTAMRREADQIVVTSRFRFTREDGFEAQTLGTTTQGRPR